MIKYEEEINNMSVRIKKMINFETQEDVKVSVIVPVYNVEKYLHKCLESLVNQTLHRIEIICVDDGSSDNSSQILDWYASEDKRIKVIHKENSGYGDSMNLGIEFAQGKYIGILESDDFAELDMFERLFSVAQIHGADIVKSNFFLYWDDDGIEKNEFFRIIDSEEDRRDVYPIDYEDGKLFKVKASIWSALYNREFLINNNIKFLDTPGASFQDTSFTFKAFIAAQKMMLVEDAYVHYRQDNSESSVNNLDKKTEFVFKEYDEIFKYIGVDNFSVIEKNDERRRWLSVAIASFYDACIWMYEGLSLQNRYDYLVKVSAKLKQLLDTIPVNEIAFGNCLWKYRDIKRIAKNPFEYHLWREVERYVQKGNNIRIPSTHLQTEVITTDNRNQIKFSIIIPVYNGEEYLTACLESIRHQKFDDFEVICINDGSSDKTEDILKYYCSIDNRFKYWSVDNSGPSVARNLGIEKASGQYVLFMDADDFYREGALEILNKEIYERDVDTEVNYVFSANAFPEKFSNEWLKEHLQCKQKIFEDISFKTFFEAPYLGIYIWKWAINREFLLKKRIRFDEKLTYGEDAVFLFNILENSKKIISLSDRLYNYRLTNKQSLMHNIEHTKEYAEMQVKILNTILDLLYGYGEIPSKELFEFCADFVYSAISENHDKKVIESFINIVKEYDLERFSIFASNNARGFYEWCNEYTKESIIDRDNPRKVKQNNGLDFIRRVIRRIFPVSRQAYYDYECKKIMLMEKQIKELNLLREEITNSKQN